MAEPDSDNFVVGGNLQIIVGPKNDPLLDEDTLDIADLASLGTGSDDFSILGFTDETGAKFIDTKAINDITSTQSFYPTRRIVGSKDASVAFMLQEWTPETIPFAFGGGEITATATGWSYKPPAPEVIDERSLVVAWEDGDRHFGIIMPKGMVSQAVESDLNRTAVGLLPITFSVTPKTGEDPWRIIGDDPAFLELLSS